MKKVLTILCWLIIQNASAQSVVSTTLQQEILQKEPNSIIDIHIFLREQTNIEALKLEFVAQSLPVKYRAGRVKQALIETAQNSQTELISFLHGVEENQPGTISIKKQYHILNMVSVSVPIALISEIASRADVEFIEKADRLKVTYDKPVAMEMNSARIVGGHEPGLEAIGAPFMWNLGYTGLGRRLYTVDTGVWPVHPAIQRQWRGNYYPESQSWLGFDFEHPADKPDAHGTHVTGTVLGLDQENNDTIGVAFNATFMATDPIVENLADVKPLEVILTAFEFALDPDNNPNTFDDVPDVICNSWGFGDTIIDGLCTDPFILSLYSSIDAAGIAVEFSAGNEGPGAATAGMPAYVVLDSLTVFSVGAVDASSTDYTIASFSSRGPSSCGETDQLKIKPEVSAPGVNVRSSVQQNQYASYSGTSMAGPHVAGAALLLKEAFPFLTGKEILNALYLTAIDLGAAGEDNIYGRGIINLEFAYNYLSQLYTPVPPNTSAFDVEIEKFIGSDLNCSGNYPLQLVIRNAGSTDFSGGIIQYFMNGTSVGSSTYSGLLQEGERDTIFSPAILFNAGLNELRAVIQPLVATTERDLVNNNRVLRMKTQPQVSMPFGESFEYNDFTGNNWHLVNGDYKITWDTIKTGGLPNSQYSGFMKYLTYTTRDPNDIVYTPFIAVPESSDSLILSFDYAYRFRSNSLSDSLEVSYSQDCGNSWIPIFYKGGEELATIDTFWTNFKPFASTHWRNERQNLINQIDGNEVIFKFRAINDNGSNFFIDNIFVYDAVSPASILSVEAESFKLFPNPADDYVELKFLPLGSNGKLTVCDLTGKVVYVGRLSQSQQQVKIQTAQFGQGIYFVAVETNKGRKVQKLVIQ